MKTKSGAKKRFVQSGGKKQNIRIKAANRNHFTGKQDSQKKRQRRSSVVLCQSNRKKAKEMLRG